VTYGGLTWAIGKATTGPADGMTYLATNPGNGYYPDAANDWAMLPAVDLSAYGMCQLRITVELFRNAEQVGLNYDGGNLQYTTDASGAAGWAIVDNGNMAYDGPLTGCSGSSCIVSNQTTWTKSVNPRWKTAVYAGALLGPVIRLRFTFHSDVGNDVGPLPGIYVRRLHVEMF
jgi:hypothetical protein